MRSLGVHSSHFRCQARERASAGADLEGAGIELRVDAECLVVMIAVERGDAPAPEALARRLADDTLARAARLDVPRVVLYPYVHLTDDPAPPPLARRVLDRVEAHLHAADGLEVLRAPFGWYKSFSLECLGHPMSEWSGRYGPDDVDAAVEVENAPRERFSRYVVVDRDGAVHEVAPGALERCPVFADGHPSSRLLARVVANELEGGVDSGRVPPHVEWMRSHELVEPCEVSEKGHLSWLPKGLLVQRLLLDLAGELAREWGAVEMRHPVVLRGDHNEVGELMGEFHERDYRVDGGRGLLYLRYASDPMAFPFMQRVRFRRDQAPLKVYEEALCFRNERQGEVSGLRRVRAFLMTDMHAACVCEAQAREEFAALTRRFAALMDAVVAPGRWVLAWEGLDAFFESEREWLVGLCRELGQPALFKLMPEMSHYYAMKNEFQVVTADGANVQVSTVQWDVKDGARFGIGHVDEGGAKVPSPVILHASSFGSIERALCAILETIAADAGSGRPPMLPLWLSPTQVRVIPVSPVHEARALEVAGRLAALRVRADVDDRDGTLGRRVRDAEVEWIPYVAVVGDRELGSGRLAVRDRADRRRPAMSVDELAAAVEAVTRGLPFRPQPLPVRLSRRPSLLG